METITSLICFSRDRNELSCFTLIAKVWSTNPNKTNMLETSNSPHRQTHPKCLESDHSFPRRRNQTTADVLIQKLGNWTPYVKTFIRLLPPNIALGFMENFSHLSGYKVWFWANVLDGSRMVVLNTLFYQHFPTIGIPRWLSLWSLAYNLMQ